MLRFSLLDFNVGVRCADAGLRGLLAGSYARRSPVGGRPRLSYGVERVRDQFRLTRLGGAPRRAASRGELLHLLDSDLAVQLQRGRRHLLFLHAAVLVRGNRAALLIGASGSGKSTAAWALAHHGFRYAGDELAPVDVETLRALPCPRALCLKAFPPRAYPLPSDVPRTSWGWHVPLRRLPGGLRTTPVAVGAAFFVSHAPRAGRSCRRLSKAEAAARLYACALNPLAHAGKGLDPAVRIAEAVPAFQLDTARLGRACRRVAAILGAAPHAEAGRPRYRGRSPR